VGAKKPRRVLRGHRARIIGAAFLRKKPALVSVSSDGIAILWSTKTGKRLARMRVGRGTATAMALSRSRDLLAVGWKNKKITLWDLTKASTGKARATRKLSGHSRAVTSLAFSPNGRLLASGSVDRTIALWKVKNGKRIRVLHGHRKDEYARRANGHLGVLDLAFSPNGRLLASVGADNRILLWRVKGGKRLHAEDGQIFVNSLAFSANGRLLASGGTDGTIVLWKVAKLLG
jgi:WD40 repeat protein